MQIPISALPNQSFQVQLANQPCTIDISQTAYGLFFGLYVGSTQIITSVICENLNRLVRSVYLGFIGDFVFLDTQGSDDPVYTGLGTRWLLIYLEQSDLGGLG